jgi:D-aminoacyl-tRNA deacylase
LKVVIQRSLNSKVLVEGETISEISHGLVLLVCVERDDDQVIMKKASDKIIGLRCFQDSFGKINLNIEDVKGEILAISQFTLSWDGKKGNRPGFENSMKPKEAENLFNLFCLYLSDRIQVKKGVFGAHMNVFIENNGPVTFSLQF